MLQNIFLKAYTNLNGFDRQLSFNSWIYRIAHNEVIDWSRRNKTKIKYGQQDIDDEIFERTESYENFVKEIELREDKIIISRVLETLDLNQKEEIKDMKENGAERSDIKEQLEDWGVELPTRGDHQDHRGHKNE